MHKDDLEPGIYNFSRPGDTIEDDLSSQLASFFSRFPEKHKQDLLTKQKAGKGHWKPELASDSEEAVKADRARDAAGGVKEDISKLQERTKSSAEDTAKSGTSMRDGL